jgi:hypothetical protein
VGLGAKLAIRTLSTASIVAAFVVAACAPPVETDPDAAVPWGPHPVAVDPAPGAVDVPIDKVIRIEFSDHVDGHSIHGGLFGLHSGPVSMWEMSFYDPVRGRLSVWPSVGMRKNATWVLELSEGLTGLSGAPVEPGIVTEFRTGEEAGDNEPFPFLTYETDVAPIFDAHCAWCHSDSSNVAGLKLDSVEGVAGTALGVASDGWPGWKRITASRPGESYLLYKIIGDERITGAPMPTVWEDSSSAAPLSAADQETIADWIASGAAFFDPDADAQ